MRTARAVVASALVAMLAGCASLPQSPPPLPATFIPEVESTAAAGSTLGSTDGFTTVEHVAMRVRVETCTGYANGSAWVLDQNTLVTNRHVIEGATEIEVTSYDGRDYTGTSSVLADFADLALITVDGELTEHAVIATEPASGGDELSIVGYPEGSRLHTESGPYGIQVPETLGEDQDPVFSVGADAKPGNSGSPVVNEDGEVVGVLYAANEDGVSYAVTLESLNRFLGDEDLHQPNDAECDW